MKSQSKQFFIFIAWVIALTAMLTSLYSSEIGGLPVCHLCWYQRICVYPLSIILGIGAFQNDTRAIIYGLPFSVIGGLFALYQYLQQMIPGFAPIEFCSPDLLCSTIHFRYFGFITFPFLSLVACCVISSLLTLCLISKNTEQA